MSWVCNLKGNGIVSIGNLVNQKDLFGHAFALT